MRKRYLIPGIITLAIFFSCTAKVHNAATPDQSNSNAFAIKRGTNIAHWLSQSKKRGQERADFFTKADVDFIKSKGFDHIRLPVDEEQLWDSTGKRNEDAFQLLQNCMTWVHDAGLKVVLDLHIIRSHYFNSQENRLWTH